MTLPIKTLPIVECWTCTGCGKCCRGNIVPLDDDDLAKLHTQQWDKHPDFRGVRTVESSGWLVKSHRLAQRNDGTCVFLERDGLCRIHKEHGLDSKPLVCRMYPLQLVPVDDTAYLTLRRSCPTAANEQGSEMSEHRKDAKSFVRERPRLAEKIVPPQITKWRENSWKETLQVTGAIERLMTDERFPLIRRLVHSMKFCDLLETCRLRKLDVVSLDELVSMLSETAIEESSEFFQDREPPSKGAGVLLRQTVLAYLRLHPRYTVRESWRERLRLFWASLRFTRGKGAVPKIHKDFPDADFESIEEPLGHLDEDVQRPFVSYFEATAVSKQYAVVSRTAWSVVEKFRALALAYPVALWMLAYFRSTDGVTHEQAIDMVTTIDRGQGHDALVGTMHRRRISTLARLGELERLAVWYAR